MGERGGNDDSIEELEWGLKELVVIETMGGERKEGRV
jgi:hypothetical protein